MKRRDVGCNLLRMRKPVSKTNAHTVRYFLGILDSSKDDFEDADEVYEAIGEVLHEVEEKSENEVRSVNLHSAH